MRPFQNLKKLPVATQRALISTFFTGLLFWSSMASQLPALPLYVKSLGGTPAQIGWVMGAFAVGLLLCRSPLGKFSDRCGRTKAMQVGLAVAAIMPLFYTTFPSIPMLLLFRAIHGISIAAFTSSYSALVSDLAPPQQRGEIIGYMSLVNPLGLAFGPALGSWVQEALGYQMLFALAALLATIGLVITLQIRESTWFKPLDLSPQVEKPSFWQTLLSTRVRVPASILLMIGLIFGTLSSFLPLLMKAQHISLQVGLFYMTAAIAGFVIRLPIANISDLHGRGIFISIGLCFYSLSMAIIAIAHTDLGFLTAAVLEGIGSGITIPAVVTLLSDRSIPTERGYIFSITWIGFDLGIAIAGPTIGNIIAFVGLNNAFVIAASLGVLALLIFITQANHSLKDSLRFAIGQSKDKYAV